MVLNLNGIEPSFLNWIRGRRGRVFSYYNLQCIKLDKGKKNSRKKNQFYAYKKQLTQFLKMGSFPFWVQFHAYYGNHSPFLNFHFLNSIPFTLTRILFVS